MNVRFEIGNKVERDEIWDYPIPTIREAVTNAICHRDYSHLTNIQIKIFNDSIEIWNPGFLPHGLTVEKLWSGDYSSEPRNVLIAQVMFEMEIIEQYGSGIGRMRDYCLEAGLPEPEIREQTRGTLVVFKKTAEVTPQVTPQVDRLLRGLDSDMGRTGLQKKLGLSDKRNFVNKYLSPALESGLIEMTIPDKPRSRLQKYRLTDKLKRIMGQSGQALISA